MKVMVLEMGKKIHYGKLLSLLEVQGFTPLCSSCEYKNGCVDTPKKPCKKMEEIAKNFKNCLPSMFDDIQIED